MRHARLVPAVAGLMVCLAIAGIAAAQELPRVRLVATGGTISNRAGGRLIAGDRFPSGYQAFLTPVTGSG